MLHHDRHGRGRVERDDARQHFVEHDPQAVDVGPGVEFLAQALLWGHVVRRTDHAPGLRQVVQDAQVPQPRDPEVQHLHAGSGTRERDDDVVRLDVAMDDVLLVRRVQRTADLRENLRYRRRGQRPVLLDEAPEGVTLHQFHHEVHHPFG